MTNKGIPLLIQLYQFFKTGGQHLLNVTKC